MSAIKVARQPLAFGMTRWGPLPDTADLFLFWGGPGDGLYMTKGEDGPHKRVRHGTASGTYGTVKQAQGAVDAFCAEDEGPTLAVVLVTADGEAREARVWPCGDYACPFCGGAVKSAEGWAEMQRLNAESYARQGEPYEAEPYSQWMREIWEARKCANPACLVNMNAEQVAAARQRIADREADEASRKRGHERAMERIQESREAEAALWDELSAKAREAGQCVSCLRASYWQSRPKFVRHRDAANCPARRRWS